MSNVIGVRSRAFFVLEIFARGCLVEGCRGFTGVDVIIEGLFTCFSGSEVGFLSVPTPAPLTGLWLTTWRVQSTRCKEGLFGENLWNVIKIVHLFVAELEKMLI